MLSIITQCLLIILLIMQISLMIYLFILNHIQYKKDKIFWETMEKRNNKLFHKLDGELLNAKVCDKNEQNK